VPNRPRAAIGRRISAASASGETLMFIRANRASRFAGSVVAAAAVLAAALSPVPARAQSASGCPL
jgi:hypothetical protein